MKQESKVILFIMVLININVIGEAYVRSEKLYWLLVITLPLLVLALINIRKKKQVR